MIFQEQFCAKPQIIQICHFAKLNLFIAGSNIMQGCNQAQENTCLIIIIIITKTIMSIIFMVTIIISIETKSYLADGWWIVQMMVRPSRANSCKSIVTIITIQIMMTLLMMVMAQ